MQGFLSVHNMLTVAVALAVVGITVGLLRLLRAYALGKSAIDAMPITLLFTIPKRYMVDLHHIVMRDKKASYAHMLAAGSVVLAFFSVVFLLFTSSYVILSAILNFVLIAGMCGSAFFIVRRFKKLSRLSTGAWNFAAFAPFSFCMGLFGVLNSNHTVIYLFSALLLIWGVIEIFFGVALSRPLKHWLVGFLHLAFHPRQNRFKGKLSSALRTNLGVDKITDFNWNQLLSFDVCVECGKCEQVCPAFAAGQPLNPKKIIQDLSLAQSSRSDANYGGSLYPNKALNLIKIKPQDSLLQVIDRDTLYSCTSCRACVEVCPMMIEHVDAIVDMRRNVAINKGKIPENSAIALKNLRQTNTVGGFDVNKRNDWAADLDIDFLEDVKSADVLLWAGESAFDLRSQGELRKLVKLLKIAKVDFVLLKQEQDCGDLARRLGEEVLFKKIVSSNVNYLSKYSFNKILTMDAHAYHLLKNEYQEFNADYKVVHHSEYLLQLVSSGIIKTSILSEEITYHDPCYLGRYNNVVSAPRELLSKLGVQINEMQRSKLNSRCCGWGGGAAFSDIKGERRIPDMRMQEITNKASTVAVACPNCTTMLEGVVEPRAQVKDIVDFVYRSNQRALA